MATASDPQRVSGWVAACFAGSALAALGLGFVWWTGASTQVAGVLLATALGLLSAGTAAWANRLVPQGPFVEQRGFSDDDVPEGPEDEMGPRAEGSAGEDEESGGDRAGGVVGAAAEDFAHGAQLPRRGLVVTTLTGAAAALGAALVVPFGALGPRPGDSMLHTQWQRGRRAVDAENRPVAAADVPVDGIVTVFPEGDAGSADGQVVLVRVGPDLLDLPMDRSDWAVDGLVGYSKVCTHAGCPVGLYISERHELLCPCHQSAFDVLQGAKPTHGPAAWPLPQLPLSVDGDGWVRAAGALSEPVGPGWWKT